MKNEVVNIYNNMPRLNLQVPEQPEQANQFDQPVQANQPGQLGQANEVALPFTHSFTPFNINDKYVVKTLRKLKKYTNKGIYREINIGNISINCKLTIEFGYDNILSDVLKDFESTTIKKDFEHSVVRNNYYNLYVLSECKTKILLFEKFFFQLVWNILGSVKFDATSYIYNIWLRQNNININRGRNRNLDDRRPCINSTITRYFSLGNDELECLSIIYFKETFTIMLNRLADYIKAHLDLDEETMSRVLNNLNQLVGAIMIFYGENAYNSIFEDIDNILIYLQPQNWRNICNRYTDNIIEACMSDLTKKY